MKKTLLTLSLAFIICFSYATVITVNNNVNSPGQYTNLQTAIDNANYGDSIYVHGSNTNYGSVTINKAGLTLIGTGHKPQKDIPLVSTISGILFDTVQFISSGRDFKIIGMYINGSIGAQTSQINGKVNNIVIDRCIINSVSICGNGWQISRCILIAVTVNNYNNIIISNNIINGGYINSSDKTSVIVSNNIIFNAYPIGSFSNGIIQNNIFFKVNTTPFVGCVNNSFNNNISFLMTDNTLPPSGNVGANNLGAANSTGIDPKFIFVPTSATAFDYTHDYHLRSTAPISPGHNGGSDGTDIGIYGGSYPWVDMTGTPNIPQVKTFNILNPSVNAGTPVNISVKAKKQN